MQIFYLSAILLKGRFYWPAVGVAATTDPLLSLRSSCWEAALCMAAFWKLYPVWAHVEGPLEKWRHESLAQKFRCQLTYTPPHPPTQAPAFSVDGPPRHVRGKHTHAPSCCCWLAGLLRQTGCRFCFFLFFYRCRIEKQIERKNQTKLKSLCY